MITAVLDTNVLASGVVGFSDSASLPGAIMRSWALDAFRLVVSEHILTELTRTLTKPYFRSRSSAEERDRIISLLQRDGIIVPITARVIGVAPHLADDLVLATGVSGHADFLITGDRRFRAVGTYQDVKLLTPREFSELLATGSSIT